MGKSYQLNRKSRITIRLTDHEMAVIKTVASEEGVTTGGSHAEADFLGTNPGFLQPICRVGQALVARILGRASVCQRGSEAFLTMADMKIA
jgi:ABC-type methionine transport system ATPase subunit